MNETIREFLISYPGYLKKSNSIILERLGYDPTYTKNIEICATIKKELKARLKNLHPVGKKPRDQRQEPEDKKVSIDYKKIYNRKSTGDNILIIGDLHEPFCLKEYLNFCKKIYKQENCDTVIFIGDIIDNHYSSYHETDPDGYSAGEELDRAIDKIQKWYEAFPKAYVIIGNHDRLVYRKAHTAGVSKRWIREFHEVLETPGWEFLEEITINGVCYNHGEGMSARSRTKNEMQSQVQGHYHSQFYIEYNVSPYQRVFAMQVGCGIDRRAYAMAYGKHHKKPIIGCATVKGSPPVPQLHPMNL